MFVRVCVCAREDEYVRVRVSVLCVCFRVCVRACEFFRE